MHNHFELRPTESNQSFPFLILILHFVLTMPDEHNDLSMLLGIIPSSELKPEQVARWRTAGEAPTCTLLRKPLNLQELNKHNYCFAIWRENGTLTYVTPEGVDDFPVMGDRFMNLKKGSCAPHCRGNRRCNRRNGGIFYDIGRSYRDSYLS